MPDSNGEEVYEMKGERVDNVDQAFEMGLSNNIYLLFADALTKEELYDEAAERLEEAVLEDKEIIQRWDEEEKEQRDILKEILSSENVTWISHVTREATSVLKIKEPRSFLNPSESLDECVKKKTKLVEKLEKIIGLERIENIDVVIPRGATGESYKTCFPNVNFTIFCKHQTESDLEANWFYTFSC